MSSGTSDMKIAKNILLHSFMHTHLHSHCNVTFGNMNHHCFVFTQQHSYVFSKLAIVYLNIL